MSNSDEIRVGDRWQITSAGAVASASYLENSIWTATGPLHDGLAWTMSGPGEESKVWWKGCAYFSQESQAKRLPREQTIEERRAALRVGDVIREPELLCEGMRVYSGVHPAGYDNREIVEVGAGFVRMRDGGRFDFALIVAAAGEGFGRLTYLGMAAAAAPLKTATTGEVTYASYRPAGRPVADRAKVRDETKCDFYGVAHECVRARHRRSTACAPDCTPAIPCRRFPLVCPVFREEAIAVRLAAETRTARSKLDKMEAARWREPRTPSPTGLGGMIGRYRFNR